MRGSPCWSKGREGPWQSGRDEALWTETAPVSVLGNVTFMSLCWVCYAWVGNWWMISLSLFQPLSTFCILFSPLLGMGSERAVVVESSCPFGWNYHTFTRKSCTYCCSEQWYKLDAWELQRAKLLLWRRRSACRREAYIHSGGMAASLRRSGCAQSPFVLVTVRGSQIGCLFPSHPFLEEELLFPS